MEQKRVLSGIRATGRLHIGNYLGAVRGMLELQDLPEQAGNPEYETYYMVADLHTINTPYDPKTFKEDVREVVLDYLAAGLNPEKSVIFIQSHVPEHVELSYLFSSVLTVARMLHLPTYKDKLKESQKNANMAMLYYPVLMAADILAYKADAVPVGDDQLPHLEVAREVARKMNEAYGLNFPQPQQFRSKGHYVPSLTGEGKMSKSIEGSYINLTDSLETIKQRLAKVPTDSGKGKMLDVVQEKGRVLPGSKNYYYSDGERRDGVAVLLSAVELFEGEGKRKKYEKQYAEEGISYKKLKEELAEAIYRELEPIQKRRRELEKDDAYLDKILKEGAERARKIAKETLTEVKAAMGI